MKTLLGLCYILAQFILFALNELALFVVFSSPMLKHLRRLKIFLWASLYFLQHLAALANTWAKVSAVVGAPPG